MQSKLKICSFLFAGATLLLGISSCNKDDTQIVQGPVRIVERAVVTTEVGDRGATTKAAYESNTLSWTLGDKLVMVSNEMVNGTLVCEEVDASGNGTFSGDVSQFDPDNATLFFLGNQDASVVESSFDFSSQSGSERGLANYLFMKSNPFHLVQQESENPNILKYAPADEITFDSKPLVSIIYLTLDYAGTPGAEDGVTISSVNFEGLKNRMSLNLLTGNITASFVKDSKGEDNKSTSLTPAKKADYAKAYWLAVVPQSTNDISMKVSYEGSTTKSMLWTGIDWTVESGISYTTDWSSQRPTINQISAKYGYNGNAVEGGENADGLSHKGGYNGNNADGTSDNPLGSKPGYNGNDIY